MLDPRDMTPVAFQAHARSLGAHDLSIRRLLSAVVGRGIQDRAAWEPNSRSHDGCRKPSATRCRA